MTNNALSANLIPKTKFDAELKKIIDRVTSNKQMTFFLKMK